MIVVDFGTATTFDVVDEEGSYSGGVIAPGINLSIEALVNATALLPRIVVEKPTQVIGTTTVACMHSGVFWGYVGLIEGLVARIKAEFGRPMKVVVDRRPRRRCSTDRPSVIDADRARHHRARPDRDLASAARSMTVPSNDELLFLALGGAGEIGMNLNLYGHAGKWLMVDLGIAFADDSMPGVEVIMPDPAFIEERRDDLVGIVLTHAHEDHLGAVRRSLAAPQGAGLCHAVRRLGAAPQARSRPGWSMRCRSPRSRSAASSACRRSSSS